MEIEMGEIDAIKSELKNLTVHAARTDVILDQIQKTQESIAQILENQSAQKEKNKSYEKALARLNAESVENRNAISANKTSIAIIIAKSSGAAAVILLAAQYALKLFA